MHFRRPRRQRLRIRSEGQNPWFASLIRWQSRTTKLSGYYRSCRSYIGSLSRHRCSRIHHCSISGFHSIRGTYLDDYSEKQLIEVYLSSQEDPFMRERIHIHCATDPNLWHITTEYLDRIAKLKLFL
jgi:hypothetical protein